MSTRRLNWTLCFGLLSLASLAGGCSGLTGSTGTSAPAQPGVLVNPQTANARPGDPALQFSTVITGTTNTAVTWSVNSIVGGNATVGTISTTGQYTAPASVPASPANLVSVQAALVSTPTVLGTSAVTLLNPIPIVSSVSPQSIGVGAFTIQVNGSDFVNGAQVMFGGTALTTTFVSATQLTASGTAAAAQAGNITVTAVNPPPGTNPSTTSAIADVTTGTVETVEAAVRFLEQSTFGPTPALVTQVQQIGFPEFLASQFAASGSTYPDPASTVTSLQRPSRSFSPML